MKFQVKDKVIPKETVRPRSNYNVYEVVAHLDGHILAEFWGDGFGDGTIEQDPYRADPDNTPVGSSGWRGSIARYQESQLFTPEEAYAEWRRLTDGKDKLEAEFEAIRDAVKEKLNQAAVLVKEAGDIVTSKEKEFYDLPGACKELYLALKEGGWSHSTLVCKYGR